MDAQTVDPSSNNIPRDAVIYIPDIKFIANQSLESITQQIADALESSSQNKLATFSVEANSYEGNYGDRKFRYRTIIRDEGGKATRAMDVYEMDYLSSLTQDYTDKHPVNLLLRMILVIALSVRNFASLVNSPAKTAKEKVQVSLALIMVAIVLAYVFIVGAAVINLGLELPQVQSFLEQLKLSEAPPAQDQPTQAPATEVLATEAPATEVLATEAPAATTPPGTSQDSLAAIPSLFDIPRLMLILLVALIIDLVILSQAKSSPKIQQVTFWLAGGLTAWIVFLLIKLMLATLASFTLILILLVALIIDLVILSQAKSSPKIQQVTFWLAIGLAVLILGLLIKPVLAPWIVIAIAIAQLASPKLFENLRQGIQQNAIFFLSIADYFKLSTRREPIEGHFLALLEYVGQIQIPYERIYVLTYSFGGIIALDGMFPATHDPVERVKSIDGLVTIGNPSDFCRGLWPNYFRSRNDIERGENRTFVWLNVFSPIDILGSNFRKDDQVGSPDPEVIQGIGLIHTSPINIAYPRNLSYAELNFLELVSFIGLRAHTTYFRSVAQGATSCFIQVVPQLLKDTAWLA